MCIRDSLNNMEAIAIHAANPPLNKQVKLFGEDECWYYQYRDERLGPTQEKMIRDIWKHIRSEDED